MIAVDEEHTKIRDIRVLYSKNKYTFRVWIQSECPVSKFPAYEVKNNLITSCHKQFASLTDIIIYFLTNKV